MKTNSLENAGRWIGAAIVGNFVIGITSNFKLQTDLFGGEGLLVNAAAHPIQIGLIAVLGLLGSLLSIAVASTMSAHFGKAHPRLTGLYYAITAATLAITVVECATFIAFRTLSEQYLAAGTAAGPEYQLLKKVLAGLRNGVHFPHVLAGGAGVLAFFLLLYRERLVPRALAGFGVASILVQMFTVSFPLFGLRVIYPLLVLPALAFVGTAGWLLVRGFATSRDGQPPHYDEPRPAVA
ncbi:DUF4386 domain-containing protein [Tahibacter amnicola]|uniref:DUF4386 domain-containing protein n=1 Tax=Tahibacter amnicola TaxID=2976241 RepID=A0ABY6BJG0_9GAMM|nr:DUF4386 domain-containing protein [Tahibacter amnicola]UXI70158.1 DUF4386 domain-containing protein [Tahibacter amnicola]